MRELLPLRRGFTLTGSCLVARRADVLAKVRDECVAQGLNPAYVISVSADITRASDLVKVREEVVKGENRRGLHKEI